MKKIICLLLVVLLFSMSLVGCTTNNPPTNKGTNNTNPNNNGTGGTGGTGGNNGTGGTGGTGGTTNPPR